MGRTGVPCPPLRVLSGSSFLVLSCVCVGVGGVVGGGGRLWGGGGGGISKRTQDTPQKIV